METMKLLGRFPHGVADQYREIFEKEGIVHSKDQRNDSHFFIFNWLSNSFGRTRLFVAQADLDKAKVLIRDYEQQCETRIAQDIKAADRIMLAIFLGFALLVIPSVWWLGQHQGWWR